MKSHPHKSYGPWAGMHTADPPDRIADNKLGMLRNMTCDFTGRVRKTRGTSIVATAEDLGIEATDGRTAIRSIHTYEGRVGENPDQKLLVIAGSRLLRSEANNLRIYDDIGFPSDIDTPALDRAAAVAFRNEYAYHQNGLDFPFRIKCEEDDPTAVLTTDAEVLGLKPPVGALWWASSTTGSGKRFPASAPTAYAVTFVYGTRGESGPGPVVTWYVIPPTATVDELNFANLPLGGDGVTARNIYRSKIGQGRTALVGDKDMVAGLENGPNVEMWKIASINDNTTTTWTDEFDDPTLDLFSRIPQPRPFPPIAQYQIMHLDRLFWAKCRQHPWTLGLKYDPTRVGIQSGRVTIVNTGSGTMAFEKKVAGVWSADAGIGTAGTITAYKTKTLREIMLLMIGSGASTDAQSSYSIDGVIAVPQGQMDLDRTFTFKAVTQQEFGTEAYWLTAIDDDDTQGAPWFPNRFMWSDLTFPEQVSWLNSADLTRFGSKRITGLILMDNTPVVTTDTDAWLLPGSFIPDGYGVPSFEVHRSQASHGSICTRPDAMVTVPGVGAAMVAHDDLRAFRGDSSILWAPEIRDQFGRIQRDPITRDFLTATYFKGEVFIALATEETD